MKKPLLLILAGLPAAGKSTFAYTLGPLLDDALGIKTIVIASDTVRGEFPALKEAFLPDLEPVVRSLTLDRVRAGLRSGLSVIHDDLNYYKSMRFELVALAREMQVPHALILLETPSEKCLEWNALRGRKVPDEVIIKDAARFDAPGEDPWDEPFARVDAGNWSKKNWKSLVQGILKLCEQYRPWTPQERKPHTSTRAEELDQLSRKVVAELYRNSRTRTDGKEISRIRLKLVKKTLDEETTDEKANTLFREKLGELFLPR